MEYLKQKPEMPKFPEMKYYISETVNTLVKNRQFHAMHSGTMMLTRRPGRELLDPEKDLVKLAGREEDFEYRIVALDIIHAIEKEYGVEKSVILEELDYYKPK